MKLESRSEEPAEQIAVKDAESLSAASEHVVSVGAEVDALLDLLKRQARRRTPRLRKGFVYAAGATALFTSIVVTFGLSPVSPEVLYVQFPLLAAVLGGAAISGSEDQKEA